MKVKMYPVRKITDLRHMMRTSVEEFGERAAFLVKEHDEYQPISYNQYKADIEALGTALWEEIPKGSAVIVTGENCYEWAITYMAVVCGIGVIVPVDKELPEEEIQNIAKICEAKAIIYSAKTADKIKHIDVLKYSFDELPELIKKGNTLLEMDRKEYLETPIDTEELNILLFTSGTTGVSKGVMLNHRNICVNLMSMCSMVKIWDEVFLSVLPLHHTYECTCGYLCQIYRGTTIAFCEGLRYITKNMKEVKVTKMLCVPLLLESMYHKIMSNAEKSGKLEILKKAITLNNNMKKIRLDFSKTLFKDIHAAFGGYMNTLIVGGAPIDPSIVTGLEDLGIKVIQGYGLTECAPIAALNKDDWSKADSAGLPLPGVTLGIVDADENGIGEITVSGGNVMMGYYKDPELTATVLKDGVYYTGDLGYLDKDNFLHITGRKKNVIVTANGKNIFPEELETYLDRNKFVKESIVCGVMNEKKKDYDLIALIFPDEEVFAEHYNGTYTQADIDEQIKKAVTDVNNLVQNYKRLDLFVIRKDEFEKNTSKKIKRFVIKDTLNEDLARAQKA